MPTERIDDLRAFREFIDGQIDNGGADLTPEECLDLWIVENSSESEREDRVAEIQQGLDDLHAGRTRPARDALEVVTILRIRGPGQQPATREDLET